MLAHKARNHRGRAHCCADRRVIYVGSGHYKPLLPQRFLSSCPTPSAGFDRLHQNKRDRTCSRSAPSVKGPKRDHRRSLRGAVQRVGSSQAAGAVHAASAAAGSPAPRWSLDGWTRTSANMGDPRRRPLPPGLVAEASIRSLPQHGSVARRGRSRSLLRSAGGLRLLCRVAQRSAREEVVMNTQAPDRESAWPQARVERRAFRRVVVARRVDSERPARMWSLLLPQGFDIGVQSSHTPAPGPSISRRMPRSPFGARALTRPDGARWLSVGQSGSARSDSAGDQVDAASASGRSARPAARADAAIGGRACGHGLGGSWRHRPRNAPRGSPCQRPIRIRAVALAEQANELVGRCPEDIPSASGERRPEQGHSSPRAGPVAIVGTGFMATGIAQTVAAAGQQVILIGRTLQAAERAVERVGMSLDRAVARRRTTRTGPRSSSRG